MTMMWNQQTLKGGPVPLLHQIAARLREAILAGDFGPGDRLPSEAELNRVFGVSRTTARAALDLLRQEGRIERLAGRGSIVLPPRVDQPLNTLASFADDMRARSLTPSYRTRSCRVEAIDEDAAAALGVATHHPTVLIDRLLCADGWPIAASRTWLSPYLLAGLRPSVAELDQGSLYAWLEYRAGIRIARGHEFIEAAVVDDDDAEALGLDAGEPVLLVHRLSQTEAGEAVEYGRLKYRADRYRYKIDLVRR